MFVYTHLGPAPTNSACGWGALEYVRVSFSSALATIRLATFQALRRANSGIQQNLRDCHSSFCFFVLRTLVSVLLSGSIARCVAVSLVAVNSEGRATGTTFLMSCRHCDHTQQSQQPQVW